MLPIYFPYTYINRPTAARLSDCLGPVAVYQPSETQVPEPVQQLAQEGLIQIRTPVTGDETRLARLLADYRSWAALQRPGKGIDTAYLKTLKDRLPFFDDTSTTQIRSDIKAQLGERSAGTGIADAVDPLFKARLFLQLAQEFDLQSDTLTTDLARCSQMERALLKDLHGQDDGGDQASSEKEIFSGPDTADFMLAERIESWATLLLADLRVDTAGIFVTDNQSVVELLADRFPEIRKGIDLKSGAVADRSGDALAEDKQHRIDRLAALLTADFSEGERTAAPKIEHLPSAAISGAAAVVNGEIEAQVYVIPAKTPTTVWSTWAPRPASLQPRKTPAATIRNTVVVVVGETVR